VVAFRDRAGKVVASARLSSVAAPVDLYPRTSEVVLILPAGSSAGAGSIEIDPDGRIEEITRLNNVVKLERPRPRR
jgi:hypothetical protein